MARGTPERAVRLDSGVMIDESTAMGDDVMRPLEGLY
jgi:hypothetical protein